MDQVVKDDDGSFKEELEAMRGQNAFGSFYNALKDTKVTKVSIDTFKIMNPVNQISRA